MTSITQEQLSELPVRPRATILFGFAVVLLVLGGFMSWAMLAPLAEAVVAGGTIKVNSSRKQIQHLEGGIVKEILVRDGDRVKQGDVLVRLDETRSAAQLAILQDGYDAALAQQARLLAERDKRGSIVFPDSLTAHEDNPKVQEILRSQTVLWQARRTALDGEVQILEKQIAQLRESISGYAAQIHAKKKQLKFLQDELDSLLSLQKKGLGGKQRILELEKEAARLEGENAQLQSQITGAKTEISRRQLEIIQVGKNFRQDVVAELKKTQTEINDFRERINAAEHVYSHSEVRAPVDGVVVGSGVHTIGGVVAPGATLLELVPVNDKLIVEARISPQDIDKVRKGLPARVKPTAFNHRTTPELSGLVQYVSADAFQDPQTGMAYYIARIEVTEQEVQRLGDKQLQPGMVAEVFISTGERTMADYLLKPLQDSFRRAWLEE